MKIIIGIDDTDNQDSRGTGHLARELSNNLMELGFGKTRYIVRHQLLVDSRIPYTSHNSSASILFDHKGSDTSDLIAMCREFLSYHSAPTSDCGLCVAGYRNVSQKITNWGKLAKQAILTEEDAYHLANGANIFLEGLTGMKTGVIGALAAVGLCGEGNDGRILWVHGLREAEPQTCTARELKKLIKIDRILLKNGVPVAPDSRITLGEWNRPVLRNKKVSLIVEKTNKNDSDQYQVVSKEYIKSITE